MSIWESSNRKRLEIGVGGCWEGEFLPEKTLSVTFKEDQNQEISSLHVKPVVKLMNILIVAARGDT